MGVIVRLFVDPECISRTAWERVYDETLAVLHGWPHPPLRPRYRTIHGVELIVYSRDVGDSESWRICGDATSRSTAETIDLSRDLGIDSPHTPTTDIALRIANEEWLHCLLDGKTQGRPFHTLVTAVAMLIEHRFPHAAYASGDVMAFDALEAREHLRSILGEVVPLPIATEPERLRERLAPYFKGKERKALTEAVRRGAVGPDGVSRHPPLFGDVFDREFELEEHAVGCTDVSDLYDTTRRKIIDTIRSFKAEAMAKHADVLTKLDHAKPRQSLDAVVRGAARCRTVLTEMAWEEIQRASPAELRMLAVLATLHTAKRGNVGFVEHHVHRAVLESEAIRRFALTQWGATSTS